MVSPRDESVNLDLLRSAAVLFVLVNHVLLFLRLTHDGGFIRPIGHWGVLLFFVHTSLVLMLSLQRQQPLRYVHPYRVFIVRRCFRIYPLSVLIVLFVTILHLPVGHFEYGKFLPARFDALTVTSDLLLVQNLTHVGSVMEALWSLPYEMQMYLALPALFALAMAFRSRDNVLTRVAPLLGLWAAFAVIGRAFAAKFHTDMLDYVPCFISGVLGYQLWDSTRRWAAFGWPIVLAIATAAYLVHPGPSVGWVCCLFVGWGTAQFAEIKTVLLRKPCALIARYSYGVYLTHGICIWFALDLLGASPAGVRWGIFLATTILAPVALYHAIEAPMIALGSQLVLRFARRYPATPPDPKGIAPSDRIAA
jgi:peptidoglycan/LPS O-acetylase OafA/YrhL